MEWRYICEMDGQTDVRIVRELRQTDYANREFVVEDIDGRWIAFGIKLLDK